MTTTAGATKEVKCLRDDGLLYDTHDLRWAVNKESWACWWCGRLFIMEDKAK